MFLNIIMDRRTIYALMILVIVVPFFIKHEFPIHKVDATVNLYREVDKAIDKGKPILIAMDFDPSTKGECQPMATAIMRHCFARGGKVMVSTFLITSEGLCKQVMEKASKDYNAQYGKDYVYLGFKPNYAQMILGMGRDFATVYRTDASGENIKSLEVTKDVQNFDDIGVVIAISGTSLPVAWIIYANGEYKANVAIGTTAVSATQYAPYLQSKQLCGLLPGINGALTYEKMLKDDGLYPELDVAGRLANTQSAAHVAIILFIVIGNIFYFMKRSRA